MSDELIKTAPRKVAKSAVDGLYYVYEYAGGIWEQQEGGRGYKHSTSCYAHLGRMISAAAQKRSN